MIYFDCSPEEAEILKILIDEKKRKKKWTPPSFEEVELEFIERGSTSTEARKFYNYYEANGWKVGKNKMQKWKAAVAGWLSRSKEFLPANKINGNQSDFSKRLNADEQQIERSAKAFGDKIRERFTDMSE